MTELEKPFSPLELMDGQSISFRVVRYELGVQTIFPEHAPQGKIVNVARVHVRPEDKPDFPHYWDITSAKLHALILPQLRIEGVFTRRFTITAHGIPPKKSFTLDVAPA